MKYEYFLFKVGEDQNLWGANLTRVDTVVVSDVDKYFL